MKYKLSLALLAGMGSYLACSPSANAAAIVHYSLNETSGNAIDSISGVNMTPRTATAAEFGLIYGRPSVPAGTYGAITLTNAQATAFGTAINGTGFTENSQFINNTPNSALATLTGARTITAWVNPDAMPAVGRFLSSSRVDIGTVRTGWGFGHQANGTQRFTTYGRTDFNQTAGAMITVGAWQHVAMTYTEASTTSATTQFYLNGNLVGTITGTPTDGPNPNATFGLFGSGTGTEPFAGTMDDVWVFNAALTANEIRTVATGTPIPEPTSLVALGAAGLLALGRRRRTQTT